MGEKKHIIYKIEPGSIAEEMELAPGDALLAINGKEIGDVFVYRKGGRRAVGT